MKTEERRKKSRSPRSSGITFTTRATDGSYTLSQSGIARRRTSAAPHARLLRSARVLRREVRGRGARRARPARQSTRRSPGSPAVPAPRRASSPAGLQGARAFTIAASSCAIRGCDTSGTMASSMIARRMDARDPRGVARHVREERDHRDELPAASASPDGDAPGEAREDLPRGGACRPSHREVDQRDRGDGQEDDRESVDRPGADSYPMAAPAARIARQESPPLLRRHRHERPPRDERRGAQNAGTASSPATVRQRKNPFSAKIPPRRRPLPIRRRTPGGRADGTRRTRALRRRASSGGSPRPGRRPDRAPASARSTRPRGSRTRGARRRTTA